jgi:protein-export membrane protein SecD
LQGLVLSFLLKISLQKRDIFDNLDNNMESDTFFKLILIFLVLIVSFGIVFPGFFNRGIDFLNFKAFRYVGLNLPDFPNLSFKLGLDLQGGSRLLYSADLTQVTEEEKESSMQGLRDLIERRVNIFGVAEPVIRVEKKGKSYRLVIELPGIKDIKEAIKMIGETPYLEFREEKEDPEKGVIFVSTKLTGKYLKKANLSFNRTTLEPLVLLEFNSEGADVFEKLTEKNIGKRLAIYIDNVLISAPQVREKITGGTAQISGNFTVEEAKELARNLSAGALPVPINLIQEETIGPVLGKISLQKSLKSGFFGFLVVVIFMILIYRLSGLLACLRLIIYGLIVLSIFKIIPVTLTLAGIGGAVLSVGMAVDANVLIFERFKEERKTGEDFKRSLGIGFSRAWPSIRDGNFTTLIVALIMFSFGTSFVKGFALTLSLGILVSLFSAIFITKTFLRTFIGKKIEKIRWLWG